MALFASHALVRRGSTTMPQDIGDAYCQLPSPIMEEFHPSIRSSVRDDTPASLEGRATPAQFYRVKRFSKSLSSISIIRKEPLVHTTVVLEEEPEQRVRTQQGSNPSDAIQRGLRLSNARPSTANAPANGREKNKLWQHPVRPATSEHAHERPAKFDEFVIQAGNVEVGSRPFTTADALQPASASRNLSGKTGNVSKPLDHTSRFAEKTHGLVSKVKQRFSTIGLGVRRKHSLVTAVERPEVVHCDQSFAQTEPIDKRVISPAVAEGWVLTQHEVDQLQHSSALYSCTQPGPVDGIEDEEIHREDGEPLLGARLKSIAIDNGFGQAVAPRRKRNPARHDPVQRPSVSTTDASPAPFQPIDTSLDQRKNEAARAVDLVPHTLLTSAVANAASQGAFDEGAVSARFDSAYASAPNIDAAFAAASTAATTATDSSWQRHHSRESTIAPSDSPRAGVVPNDAFPSLADRASLSRPVLQKADTFADLVSASSATAHPAISRSSKRRSMWDAVRAYSSSHLPDAALFTAKSSGESGTSPGSFTAPHREITTAFAAASVAVRNLHRSSIIVM